MPHTTQPVEAVTIANPHTIHYLVAEGRDHEGGGSREPYWTIFRKGDLARWNKRYQDEADAVKAMADLEAVHEHTISKRTAAQSAEAGWVL